jgi:hypothetical protein
VLQKAVNSMSHMDYIHNIIRAAQVGQVSFNPQQIVFLNLYVSRENLLTDTLNQVWRFQGKTSPSVTDLDYSVDSI